MAANVAFELTGIKELDRTLNSIMREEGVRSINKVGREATKRAMRDFVLPEVQAILGRHSPSGNPSAGDRAGISLYEELQLRPLKRSQGNVGHTVGFADRVFTGDTFYAGFLEFGFTDRGGTKRTGDSFLRGPLYDNEGHVTNEIVNALQDFVRRLNRTVT